MSRRTTQNLAIALQYLGIDAHCGHVGGGQIAAIVSTPLGEYLATDDAPYDASGRCIAAYNHVAWKSYEGGWQLTLNDDDGFVLNGDIGGSHAAIQSAEEMAQEHFNILTRVFQVQLQLTEEFKNALEDWERASTALVSVWPTWVHVSTGRYPPGLPEFEELVINVVAYARDDR